MQKKRIQYFDVINVISCFSVVALHCNGYVHQLDHTDSLWWLHVLIEVLFYNAVPLFFMLSGATLVGYHKKYDTKTFFKKRIRKTVIPFIFMSACFSLLFIYTKYGEDSWINIGKTVIIGIVTGYVPFTTYWFFIPLFLLYAFMPFISVMMEQLTHKQQGMLMLLLFILQSCVVPIFCLSNRGHMAYEFMQGLPICNFVIYILLGYFISHNPVEKNNRFMIACAILTAFLMFGRYTLVYNLTTHDDIAFNYTAAYAVVPSATIFMLAKKFCHGKLGGGIVTESLSRRSFGVFLIQQFVIIVMFRYIDNKSLAALLMIPIVYLLCVLIVYVVQKIKFTRWIMP